MSRRRAYSLIELCIVLGLLGILTFFLWIKFDGISASTSDTAASQTLQTVAQFVDDRHVSRGIWVVTPSALASSIDGITFSSEAVTQVGSVAVALLPGDNGVSLATPSPSGACLTVVVTSDGWTDDAYVWGPERPCDANEENLP